jgi:hypothetical protein
VDNISGCETHIVLKGWRSEFSLPEDKWRAALDLAEEGGWRPEGTSPPKSVDPNHWRGDYHEPVGQKVNVVDAWLLWGALEWVAQRMPTEREANRAGYPYAEFSGDANRVLQDLIEFGRRPGFFVIAERRLVKVR